MPTWIDELKERALERGRGASVAALSRAPELPPTLVALYRAMNGATLPGEVRLSPLDGLGQVEGGVAFGRKGKDRTLFALRREALFALDSDGLIPAWVEAIEPGAWVFAARGGRSPLQVYSTLERMLAVLVPPEPTEDFGEHTFLRALNTVREALGALKPKPKPKAKPKAGRPAKAAPRRKAAAKPAKKKAAAPGRTARGKATTKPRRKR